jgi:hypothetical protein
LRLRAADAARARNVANRPNSVPHDCAKPFHTSILRIEMHAGKREKNPLLLSLFSTRSFPVREGP